MSQILASTILGIDWVKIVIHLVVFAVLMVGLTFLLYKPIVNFIKKRHISKYFRSSLILFRSNNLLTDPLAR